MGGIFTQHYSLSAHTFSYMRILRLSQNCVVKTGNSLHIYDNIFRLTVNDVSLADLQSRILVPLRMFHSSTSSNSIYQDVCRRKPMLPASLTVALCQYAIEKNGMTQHHVSIFLRISKFSKMSCIYNNSQIQMGKEEERAGIKFCRQNPKAPFCSRQARVVVGVFQTSQLIYSLFRKFLYLLD